jgi:hypothetical protein
MLIARVRSIDDIVLPSRVSRTVSATPVEAVDLGNNALGVFRGPQTGSLARGREAWRDIGRTSLLSLAIEPALKRWRLSWRSSLRTRSTIHLTAASSDRRAQCTRIPASRHASPQWSRRQHQIYCRRASFLAGSRLDFRHFGHLVEPDGGSLSRSAAYQEGRHLTEFRWSRAGHSGHESRRSAISGSGGPG